MKTNKLLIELSNLQPEFERRRKMKMFNAILLTVINTFPEEKTDIINEIGLDFKRTGAKKPTPKLPKDPNPNFRKKHSPKSGCDDCGDDIVIKPKPKASQQVTPVKDESKYNTGVSVDDVLTSKTWRDIMAEFAGLSDPMKTFMQINGIAVGNAKNPDTLAKKIFQWLQDEN